MKTTLIILLITATSFAQIKVSGSIEKPIEVGKIGNFAATWLTMEKYKDSTYRVTYRDTKFQQVENYKSFGFKDIDGAYDDLYNLIVENFATLPKEDIMIELPNDVVMLHYEKALGIPVVQFVHSPGRTGTVFGYSQQLTKKQINKLFGKK